MLRASTSSKDANKGSVLPMKMMKKKTKLFTGNTSHYHSSKPIADQNTEPESEQQQAQTHCGMTASFAMKETFDKIQAKLESAERKVQLKFGQNKREIKEF